MQDSRSGRDSVMDTYTSQETGVVGSSGTYFGPATREQYDTDRWALTTVADSGSKAITGGPYLNPEPPDSSRSSPKLKNLPDPLPEDRRRDPAQPAFLKPLPQPDEYLPSLITILSQIPLARHVLLASDVCLQDYGYEKEWWSGTAIPLPRIRTMNDDGTVYDEDPSELTTEAQRLMAFLKGTQRAYASAEPLYSILEDARINLGSYVDRFLTAWSEESKRRVSNGETEESPGDVFTSPRVQGDSVSALRCLEFDYRSDYLPGFDDLTLYDALDGELWADDRNGDNKHEIGFDHFADIFVILLKKRTNIKIPAHWYADRYVLDNSDETKKIRKAMAESELKRKSYEAYRDKLKYIKTANSDQPQDAVQYVTATRNALQKRDNGDPSIEQLDSAVRSIVKKIHSKSSQLLLRLICDTMAERRCCACILRRVFLTHLSGVEVRMEQAKMDLQRLRRAYTEPDSAELPLARQYKLRGVCTSTDTTYFMPENGEWLKVQFSNDSPSSMTTLREDAVLAAASEGSEQVLLVYANDRALQPVEEHISESLQVCTLMILLSPLPRYRLSLSLVKRSGAVAL